MKDAICICLLLILANPLLRSNNLQDQLDSLISAFNCSNRVEFDRGIQNLLDTYTLSDHPVDHLGVLLSQALAYQNCHEDQVAIQIFQKSLNLNPGHTSIKIDSMTALLHHKKGVIHYNLNEFSSAIREFQSALDQRREFQADTARDIILGLHNMGDCYFLLGDFRQAKIRLEESLNIHLVKNKIDSVTLAKSYKLIGNVLSEYGDYISAENYLFRARELYYQLYVEEPYYIPIIHEDLYDFYAQQGNILRMKEQALKSLNIFQGIAEKYDDDYWGIANAYNNLAVSFEMEGQLDSSLYYFEKSSQINRRFANRHIAYAQNLNNSSIVYRRIKKYPIALETINKAIKINQSEENWVLLAGNYHNKGEIFADLGQIQNAFLEEQKAIHTLCQKTPFDPDFIPGPGHQKYDDPLQLIYYLDFLSLYSGEIYDQSGDSEYLLDQLEISDSAISIFDNHINLLLYDQSKVEIVENIIPLLKRSINSCHLLHLRTKNVQFIYKAIQTSEKNKSVVLLNAIKKAKYFDQLASNDSLFQAEFNLRKELLELERENIYEGAERNLSAKLQSQLAQVNAQIRSTYPQINYLTEAPGISVIQNLQKKLSENEVILYYSITEDSIYIFQLTNSAITSKTVANSSQLQKSLLKYPASIFKPFTGQANDSMDYPILAYDLYEKLIPPFKNPKSSLIIVSESLLGYIPFGTLLTRNIDHQNYQKFPYLLKDYSITYHYSIALYQELNLDAQNEKNQLLACAPEYIGNSTLSGLTYNSTEVTSLKKYAPKIITGEKANKSDFLHLAPSFDILHLSCHAVINDKNVDQSFIAFSQTDDTLNPGNILYQDEIYLQNLPAQLVVLSACETGQGRLVQGEGIISLARAFFYAGAQSVLTSLWQVDDVSTTQIMKGFYAQLKKGQTKANAIRLSKLKYLEDETGIKTHPFYWAAFVTVGNSSPILLDSRLTFWPFILVGIFLIYGITLYLKNRWQQAT